MHPRMIKNKIFNEKQTLQARFLIKQNAPKAGFFDLVQMGTLSYKNIVCNLFSTNCSSESSSFH